MPITVVGAGPVGLVTALGLAQAGVPVVVLEASLGEVRTEWRGSTLHPPTLQLLDGLGLATEVLADGVRVDRLQYRDLEFTQIAEFSYDLLEGLTRFPFRVQYEQYKLLRVLRQAAMNHPDIDLRYGYRVVTVEQSESHVLAHAVDSAGNDHVVSGNWLVGTDGAHSAVRHAMGVAFGGSTYPTLSLVVATTHDLAADVTDLGPVSYWASATGRVSVIRTPDTWRVALSTELASDCASAGSQGGTDQQPYQRLVEVMDSLVGGRSWSGVPLGQHQFYRSHQRVARSLRAGRLLLAGDAAHLTSTTGGMGLNSGIHDACDLVRRIASPLRSADAAGAEQAADAYASYRHSVATHVIQPETRNVRNSGDITDAIGRTERLDRYRRLAADRVAATLHLRAVSMLAQNVTEDVSAPGKQGRSAR